MSTVRINTLFISKDTAIGIDDKKSANPDSAFALPSLSAHQFMESIFAHVLGGTALEPDGRADADLTSSAEQNNQALLNIASKDILRYLERSVQPVAGQGYDHALDLVMRALMKDRNPAFITTISGYFYAILQAMSKQLVAGQLFAAGENEKIRVLISCMLSLLPFFEPPEGTLIHIPLKINGQWRDIEYRAIKIDISPRSGLLASLLEDEDRMYDYILEPNNDEAKEVPNIVSLMGTSPDMIRGSDLAVLENYRPNHSLGEGHNLEAIGNAMAKNGRHNFVVGHSKGANMGMVIAAKFPDRVERVDCLNPAGLCASTLKRFAHVTSATWSKVNIYHQLGDPVFLFEQGLPLGVNLYGIIDPHFEESIAQYSRVALPEWRLFKPIQRLCNWFTDGIQTHADTHLRYLVAHRHAKIIPMDVAAENHLRGREFRNDIKETMNKILFPMKYGALCGKILARKATRALGITQAVTALTKTFPINAIIKIVGFAKTIAIAAAVFTPALLLTAIYSSLKILGKTIFTNCYCPTQAPIRSQEGQRSPTKKWCRTELPENGNFSKKLAQAKLQETPLINSPFSLWDPQELIASSPELTKQDTIIYRCVR